MREITQGILKGIKSCKHCGKKYFMQGFSTEDRITMMMDREKICYDCAYWKNIINYPLPYMEVVGNICIKVMPKVKKKEKTMLLGGKGKIKYFIRTDWSELVSSNDIWQIGTIPEVFREQLPPTLIELPKNIYKRLEKYMGRCKARGCFDRYNCFRYNLEVEKDKIGAFNKIPPAWQIGNEHCKHFINLDEITNDDGSVKK